MKVKWCLPHDINNNNPTFGEYRIGTKKTKAVLYVLRALAYGIFKIFYFTILKVTLSIIPHHFTTFPTSQTLFLFSLYLNIFFNYFLLFSSLFIFHSFSLFLQSPATKKKKKHKNLETTMPKTSHNNYKTQKKTHTTSTIAATTTPPTKTHLKKTTKQLQQHTTTHTQHPNLEEPSNPRLQQSHQISTINTTH